jgi:hypothetical protein
VTDWRALVPRPIAGADDAVAFVDVVGCCTWGPVPGLDFPNLAEAMGETAASVLDRTWFWKDDLHLERRLYYGKIVRGQPTFVAVDALPDFVAALGGPGLERERDPERLFLAGRLSAAARTIHAFLLDSPAQPTRAVRQRTPGPASATERGLVELQRRFLVCKVGLTGRTRGTYSYVWDLAERFWPEAFVEARRTSPVAARASVRHRLRACGVELDPALEAKLLLWG